MNEVEILSFFHFVKYKHNAPSKSSVFRGREGVAVVDLYMGLMLSLSDMPCKWIESKISSILIKADILNTKCLKYISQMLFVTLIIPLTLMTTCPVKAKIFTPVTGLFHT